MILLMGGTSESVTIANALAMAGHSVLVSMATEVPLALTDSPAISLRRGRLDRHGLESLMREHAITVLIDAMHPYATEAHAVAYGAAHAMGIPCLRWQRPQSELANSKHLHLAVDHPEAARLAVSFGLPILLTIGSRNLAPYVVAARSEGISLHARLLPCAESRQACELLQLDEHAAIFARGPFSVEDTVRLIRHCNAGVLVTKESGVAGGVPQKLAACDETGCVCVMVQRPDAASSATCSSLDELFSWLKASNNL